MSKPLLQIEDLRVRFETRQGTVNAVNGISYTLHTGETIGIVGESGSGKSVSTLAILRLLPETTARISGKVIFDGRELLALPITDMRAIRGRQIAMVFQDPMTSLNPVLTIGRQIAEPLQLHMGMNEAQARRRVVELLELVGIPDAQRRLSDYPHQFSGGMRQRVMIAMALACTPPVLIADEPTTALDVTIQAQIVDLVRDLRQSMNMALIWITHDLGVVAGLVDRVVVMYAGYVVEDSPIDALYAFPQHPYTAALLRSVPRVDQDSDKDLQTIGGAPPDLTAMPAGCPFADRCDFVLDKCRQQNPSLLEVAPGRRAACWVNIDTGQLHDEAHQAHAAATVMQP
jgi:oligopeptide transport system ATP-binding protein